MWLPDVLGQTSGLPYLRRPSLDFHDIYLILKDFVSPLKCNQWFAWKQSLHHPACCGWHHAVIRSTINLASFFTDRLTYRPNLVTGHLEWRKGPLPICRRAHLWAAPLAPSHASSSPLSPPAGALSFAQEIVLKYSHILKFNQSQWNVQFLELTMPAVNRLTIG